MSQRHGEAEGTTVPKSSNAFSIYGNVACATARPFDQLAPAFKQRCRAVRQPRSRSGEYMAVHLTYRRVPEEVSYIGVNLIHGRASHIRLCISNMAVHLTYCCASHIWLCICGSHIFCLVTRPLGRTLFRSGALRERSGTLRLAFVWRQQLFGGLHCLSRDDDNELNFHLLAI